MPHLTKITHLHFDPNEDSPAHLLLPGTVISFCFYEDRIVFRVWDYRLNHSVSFSVDFDAYDFDLEVNFILHNAPKLSSKVIELVGNGDEVRCYRRMGRSSIDLGHSISITSTARFFRQHSYPYTTTLHNSIPGWHSQM
jgi:hypothetical protein